ncbi:MAG: YlmC/YmxH family sporulation protein [Clostridiales bacterium]|nr:YlmC/YmxH family sporulation protein [Clostridiales bacterium]
MRMFDLKRKEVINICDCKRLGYVGDVQFDPVTGRITDLVVPGPGCLCGIFGREKEWVIPFGDVKQIGEDLVLVDLPKPEEAERNCEG